jgi:hypothetical protein
MAQSKYYTIKIFRNVYFFTNNNNVHKDGALLLF